MKLESQLTSLELSKRLDELGVKQESLFYWVKSANPNYGDWLIAMIDGFNHVYHDEAISAFTIAELGETLPDWTETVKRAADDWVCIVRHKNDDINYHSFGKTEADARAKMLIYLLENGLIKND
jgi:hypothetical protein